MNRLKILSSLSPFHVRSALFEELISDVLRHHKYHVDRILGVGDREVRIDVTGHYIPTGSPFYAECRYYDRPVSVAELQAFYGKYMTRWHNNKACHGIFIALPGLDSSAKQFFKEHINKIQAAAAYLYEHDDVLETISEMHKIVSPETFKRPIAQNIGRLGDNFLLYTERGIFWAQHIVSRGKEMADRVALFNINGTPLSEKSVREYLTALYPEFDRLESIAIGGGTHPQPGLFHGTDEIVETVAGSGLFDYHLPASYERFVGRKSLLAEFDAFIEAVVQKKASSRSVLFEAPSGWGKSSTVIACAARLNALGHTAVAVDTRTASSSRFLARVFDHAMRKTAHVKEAWQKAGDAKGFKEFDGSVESLRYLGKQLERDHRLLVVFFDQCENIFFMPEFLRDIKNIFLNVHSAQTNIVLCFSWKTDLSGLDHELAQNVHQLISESSKQILISPFSESAITSLFSMLCAELNETISKKLQASISKRSQGYPWLLKRWFAHVATMVRKGAAASDILKKIPKVDDLFQADVNNLPVNDRDALFYIAKAAPVSIFDVDTSFAHPAVQNLMARKLAVKIGGVCDVYSDIFRNYLIDGDLPFVENYIFRAQVTDVQNGVRLLAEKGGSLNMVEFTSRMGLAKNTLSKVIREMNLLGCTEIVHGNITLRIKNIRRFKSVDVAFRHHLKYRLGNHRPIQLILRKIKDKNTLTLEEISRVLKMTAPHMSATRTGWKKHSQTLVKWMDVADMALWDKKGKELVHLNPETDIRERNLLLPKRRGSKTPWIQYAHVRKIIIRLVRALDGSGSVDWNDLEKRSIFRALTALEDLGFITRNAAVIKVLPKGMKFVRNPDKRSLLFAASAMKIFSFSVFIDILKSHQDKGNTLLQLGLELREALGTSWKESTAEMVAKILLDWARHAKLAPGVFAEMRKGPIKGWKKKEDRQLTLF